MCDSQRKKVSVNCYTLSETAQVIDLGSPVSESKQQTLIGLHKHLQHQPFKGFVEAVPAYTTLTVYFRPVEVSGLEVRADLLNRISVLAPPSAGDLKAIEIPVCYQNDYAPDLLDVANRSGLTPDEVIAMHLSTDHRVQFLGFAPGLPYLGTLPPALSVPRRASPRMSVPAGSVAIANRQTVIYPFDTPAGWHVIGRTWLQLFQPLLPQPALLQPGDHVRFLPVSTDEFQEHIF